MSLSRRPRERSAVLLPAVLLAGAAGLVAPTGAAAQVDDPAPPCTAAVPRAGFVDRDTVPAAHGPSVDCLALYEVTQGVPAGDGVAFLPDATLTRGQMASFLARGLTAAGYELPAPSDRFTDLDASVHAEAVRRLAAAGIVTGVTEQEYRPQDELTRAQTASLLLRAAAFARGVSVDSLYADGPFTDVAGSVHAPAIGGAARLGLVSGVSETAFQPVAPTTRAQMASLVARLLDLEAVPSATCTNPEGAFSIAYPVDWQVNDGSVLPECSAFDPASVDIPPASEIPTGIAAVWRDEPVAFDTAVSPGMEADLRSEVAFTVDGRRAVRQELVSTGEGLHPAGLVYTRVAVDRGDSTLLGTTYADGEVDYDLKRAVLTRMALSLDLSGTGLPPFVPADAVLTSRTDGAGLGLVDVRTGSHQGFDRVVFEFQGTGEVGWVDVDYSEDPTFDPSGQPVELAGDGDLTLGITGVGIPPDLPDIPWYDGPDRLAGPGGSVVEVVLGGPFEGIYDAFVGADVERPFRVFRLSNPERLVVDVAHTG